MRKIISIGNIIIIFLLIISILFSIFGIFYPKKITSGNITYSIGFLIGTINLFILLTITIFFAIFYKKIPKNKNYSYKAIEIILIVIGIAYYFYLLLLTNLEILVFGNPRLMINLALVINLDILFLCRNRIFYSNYFKK